MSAKHKNKTNYPLLPSIPSLKTLRIIIPDNITSKLTHNSPTQQPEEIFIEGQFLYIKYNHNREMLVNAWNAITELELWDYMKKNTDSYMFSNDKEILIIIKKMEELGYIGHSGYTFGWTMRQIQYIAKNGEENYRDKYISQDNC